MSRRSTARSKVAQNCCWSSLRSVCRHEFCTPFTIESKCRSPTDFDLSSFTQPFFVKKRHKPVQQNRAQQGIVCLLRMVSKRRISWNAAKSRRRFTVSAWLFSMGSHFFFISWIVSSTVLIVSTKVSKPYSILRRFVCKSCLRLSYSAHAVLFWQAFVSHFQKLATPMSIVLRTASTPVTKFTSLPMSHDSATKLRTDMRDDSIKVGKAAP
mmetsp:Transcript_19275/g.57706  ORF Transcript_19275/g.57706 Transcript_19275/m.57706 type:complete len:211 (+) Transcript_19275:3592-4224(+)